MFLTCLFQVSLKDSNDVYFTFLSRLCRIANTPPVKGNGHLKALGSRDAVVAGPRSEGEAQERVGQREQLHRELPGAHRHRWPPGTDVRVGSRCSRKRL